LQAETAAFHLRRTAQAFRRHSKVWRIPNPLSRPLRIAAALGLLRHGRAFRDRAQAWRIPLLTRSSIAESRWFAQRRTPRLPSHFRRRTLNQRAQLPSTRPSRKAQAFRPQPGSPAPRHSTKALRFPPQRRRRLSSGHLPESERAATGRRDWGPRRSPGRSHSSSSGPRGLSLAQGFPSNGRRRTLSPPMSALQPAGRPGRPRTAVSRPVDPKLPKRQGAVREGRFVAANPLQKEMLPRPRRRAPSIRPANRPPVRPICSPSRLPRSGARSPGTKNPRAQEPGRWATPSLCQAQP